MAIIIATTAGNVLLKEAWDGFEKGIDVQRGPYVIKHYLCEDWGKTDAVCNALVSAFHVCPESPNLYCLHAAVRPKGEFEDLDGQRPKFRHGVIEATYGLRPWEAQESEDPGGKMSFPQPGDTAQSTPYLFMEQSIDTDVEVIKLPNTCYKFQASGLPLNVPVGKSIAVASFVLIRRYVSVLPYANVTEYQSSLNNAVFLGQPIGTIQFKKARCRRQYSTDAKNTQEVEYIFKWREYDHNMQHKPDTSGFDFIVDDSGNKPYKYKNLAALLS